MTQNLISILMQHSESTKPDAVTLWHTTNDADTLKSFLDEGAKPIGTGQGGQTGGFFVWSKKKEAVSHFTDYLSEGTTGDGLIIGTEVSKKELVYPNWQFDLELAAALNPVLFKYKDQITDIKNLEYLEDGGKKIIPAFTTLGYTRKDNCALRRVERVVNGISLGKKLEGPGDSGIVNVNIWQAIIDKMCENPDFRKDYNKCLQAAASHPSKNFALKYCGEKPLQIDEVFHIQKDETGKVTETPLYTSSVPKEKQVCPFVKMGMVRKKGARES